MGIEKWERYGLLAGPAFVVVLLVTTFLPGQPPDLNAPGAEVRQYLIDQSWQLQAAAVLGAIAGLFGLWWIASVWRAMTKAEYGKPHLALITTLGFIGAGVMSGVNTSLLAAGSLMGEELTPEIAQLVWVASTTVFGPGAYMFCAATLAVGLLVLRQSMVPTWFGYASLVLAAAWAVAGLLAGVDAAWLLVFAFVAYLGTMVWVLGFTALLWRNPSSLDLRSDEVSASVRIVTEVG